MRYLDHLRILFGMPARKPTEQVGDPTAPGQATPWAHAGQQAPPAMAQIEWTGADFDQVATMPVPPRASRTWRTPISSPTPPNNDDVSLSEGQADAAGAHLSRGAADDRRAMSDRSAGPAEAFRPSPETTRNVRELVRMDPEAAPARPRQGFTGEDPTRAAHMPVAFTIRPFDKGIADHPGTVAKAGQPNPLASRPPERKRLIGGRPSPAGSEGTGMLPVGGQPNTLRTVPGAWDAALVTTGGEYQPGHTRRASGWRLR